MFVGGNKEPPGRKERIGERGLVLLLVDLNAGEFLTHNGRCCHTREDKSMDWEENTLLLTCRTWRSRCSTTSRAWLCPERSDSLLKEACLEGIVKDVTNNSSMT